MSSRIGLTPFFLSSVIQPEMNGPKDLTCVSFDEMWSQWGISTYNWVWAKPTNIQIRSDDCIKGSCGYFDGTAKMEIPFFANAFSAFQQFSISLWYKRMDLGAGFSERQSLVTNGDCESRGPVQLVSPNPDTCEAGEENQAGTYVTLSGNVSLESRSAKLY